ncbi:hypothetical protein DFH09DRAFT_1506355 [Mycena vulgaris]|nr:hypothetical protein DFH09DRAFT_1506355 [Mycena vulgaris]
MSALKAENLPVNATMQPDVRNHAYSTTAAFRAIERAAEQAKSVTAKHAEEMISLKDEIVALKGEITALKVLGFRERVSVHALQEKVKAAETSSKDKDLAHQNDILALKETHDRESAQLRTQTLEFRAQIAALQANYAAERDALRIEGETLAAERETLRADQATLAIDRELIQTQYSAMEHSLRGMVDNFAAMPQIGLHDSTRQSTVPSRRHADESAGQSPPSKRARTSSTPTAVEDVLPSGCYKEPHGQPGRPNSGGYSLEPTLIEVGKWTKDAFTLIQSDVHYAADRDLDTAKSFQFQDAQKVTKLCKAMATKYGMEEQYEDYWPYRAMLKMHLKNRSEAHRKSQEQLATRS